jgi:hypothetical protein
VDEGRGELKCDEVVAWYLNQTMGKRAGSLTSLVPERYPAVVRVLNPVTAPDGSRFRWSDIAGPKVTVDAETEWSDIVAAAGGKADQYYEPEAGTIDPGVARRLITLLSEHTESSRCVYLVWEGYSALTGWVRHSETITNSMQRTMHVLTGGLEDALKPIDFPPNRIAMNWLPQDASWFVGNDIYARSVFVGASTEVAGSLLREGSLEAYMVSKTHAIVPED